ncbi:extracellular solute-binding protein [Cohnella lupini]|uniref:Multiple sugar transport system substrate-binding protein n=1 Tax=Cohnella lupini TaxID=1294267 RepID=A0A3D9I3S7_9BACL|nr:extracellular solute-binding protein [Cohnella lupini]RED56300.1 multiple sugar transport system substrate-binding protein [Cohnella lupini]
MSKSKSLSLLTFFLVLVFSLAACSSGNNNNGAAETTPASQSATAEAPVSSEPSASEVAPAEETYDLGGREIVISHWWDDTPNADTPAGEERLKRISEVEKKYNVKIKYVNTDWDTYAEKITTSVMAGAPLADIVYIPSNTPQTLIKGGYIVPLDDYMNVQEETKLSDEIIKAASYGTGKTYGFLTAPPLFDNKGLLYNKRIFEESGLPTPEEDIKNGTWNWDTFVDVLKKLTISKSGSGEIDQWGLTGSAHSVGTPLIYANGGSLYDETTQKVVADSPEVIEALEFQNKLYNEYKVFKRDEGNDWEDPARYFTEGKVAFYPTGIFEIEPRFLANMKDGYGFVPWPNGPKAKSADFVMGLNQMHVYAIPRGVEDPKTVYKIWEDLQNFDTIDEDNRTLAESYFSDEDSVNEAMNTFKIAKYELISGFGIEEAMGQLYRDVVDGKVTPAAGIAQVLPTMQASTDKIVKGN